MQGPRMATAAVPMTYDYAHHCPESAPAVQTINKKYWNIYSGIYTVQWGEPHTDQKK